jgi:hypothetical protein
MKPPGNAAAIRPGYLIQAYCAIESESMLEEAKQYGENHSMYRAHDVADRWLHPNVRAGNSK